MITFLFINLVVILSAALLAARVFGASGKIDFFLSAFILYLSQITLTELCLGIFGILTLKNVILINLVIFLIILLCVKNRKISFRPIQVKNKIGPLLNHKTALFLSCIILVFGLIKIIINLVNPPFGWDSLNYHFTFPVEWLKHGNLGMPITISDDPSPPYYPINGSLFYLWLILPLGNVFLADLGQLPFFIAAFLAVYAIARKIGIRKEFSFYAAGLFVLIPNFFKQLSVAYVDVMVAALFLICLLYLFLLNENFCLRYTVLYGMSLGLLLGTKTIALPYSILLFIPFIYLWLKNIKKSHLLVTALFFIILLSAFTYFRNFLDTGNPLYPLDFKLFGRTIFKGVMEQDVYRAHFRQEDYSLAKLLFHEGSGTQALLFIFPFVFLALPIALVKEKKKLGFDFGYFLILPFLIYLVYRYVIPLANTRYLYALFGVGMASGFYSLQVLKFKRKIIAGLVFLCAFVSMFELAKRQELVAAVILTFLLFFSAPYLARIFRKPQVFKKPLSVFLIFVAVFVCLTAAERYYVKNEFSRYKKMVKYSHFWPDAIDAWIWLNQDTIGNNIAYVGRPVPFPLYGSDFKNNVYYVSVNKTEPAKLHYFKEGRYHWGYDFLSLHRNLEEQGNYRSGADYSVWLDNLLKRNTEYLFVYSLHQTKETEFPMEDKWAKDNPATFKPVFTNATIHIYKVSK